MKTIRQGILASVACLFLATATQTFAIEGLKIAVCCPDVILSWPSATNETYIVQYRPDLGTNSTWVTLTNSLPAATATNVTFFVHSNMVTCPSGGGGGGGGGGGSPPSLDSAMSLVSGEIDAPVSADASPLPVWVIQRRPPHPWELENRPPFPWEDGASLPAPVQRSSALGVSAFSQGADNPQPLDDSGGGGSGGDPGFYRVVRNGVHLVGITNGMTLSGVVLIPVEAGYDGGNLDTLSMTENGAAISPGAVLSAPFTPPVPHLVLDTAQMSNGVHQIVASGAWYIQDNVNNGLDAFVQTDSPPVTVNVYNEISFANWMPEFGQLYNSLMIAAQSGHTNADWYIDFYGSQNAYIGTMAGHTYDGNIEVGWNLIGPYGESHYDDDFFEFVITTVYSDPVTNRVPTPPIYKVKDVWPGNGDWVVANQLFWENWVNGDELDTMTDGFVGGPGGATSWGLTVRPSGNDVGEAFRIHYNDGSEATCWQSFRQALYYPTSRNVFYMGHGAANGIGYDLTSTNKSILQPEIATKLATIPAGLTNRHGYRFVFLDGCETADGKLPEAFGIIHKVGVPDNYYVNGALRHSAFVGWNVKPAIGVGNQMVFLDHIYFIQNFLYWWGSGTGLRTSLNRAPSGPLNPNNINPAKLTVYGYADLGVVQDDGQ